jgi:uncharacterized membrane protein
MKLETFIARLLSLGTALACALTTAGLAFGDKRTIVAGIACFIALPILRVMVLVVAFAIERDARFVAVGSLVLGVIGLGVVLIGK